LITFTLPQELRGLAWAHQKSVYTLLMQCAWETLAEFAAQHRQLKGSAGAVGAGNTGSGLKNIGLEGELARSVSRQFEATRSEPRLLVFRPSAWARSTVIQGRRAATSTTDFAPLV